MERTPPAKPIVRYRPDEDKIIDLTQKNNILIGKIKEIESRVQTYISNNAIFLYQLHKDDILKTKPIYLDIPEY